MATEFDSQIKLMNEILSVQFSEDFIRKMKARVFVGFHRYGQSKQYAETNKYDIIETIKARLKLYQESGNQEHLVDAANFIMIEYMYPQHPNPHFEAVAEEDPNRRAGVVRKTETLLRYGAETKRGIY